MSSKMQTLIDETDEDVLVALVMTLTNGWALPDQVREEITRRRGGGRRVTMLQHEFLRGMKASENIMAGQAVSAWLNEDGRLVVGIKRAASEGG